MTGYDAIILGSGRELVQILEFVMRADKTPLHAAEGSCLYSPDACRGLLDADGTGQARRLKIGIKHNSIARLACFKASESLVDPAHWKMLGLRRDVVSCRVFQHGADIDRGAGR